MAEPNYRNGIKAAYQGVGVKDEAIIQSAGDDFIAMTYGTNGHKPLGREGALKTLLERDFAPTQREKARETFEEAAGLKKPSLGGRIRGFLINPLILVILAILVAWMLPFSPEANTGLVFFFIFVFLALAFTEWKGKKHFGYALAFGALVFVGTLGLATTGPLSPDPQVVTTVEVQKVLTSDEELSKEDPDPTPTATVQPGG